MYCEKCGTNIGDDGRFCPNCGAEVGGIPVVCVNYGQTVTGHVTSKRRLSRKKLSLILLIVVVLAAALIFIFNNGVNKTAESVAIAAVESEYEIDIDKMVKVFPDFTIRELAVDYGLPVNASRNDVAEKLKYAYRHEMPVEITNVEAVIVAEYDLNDYTIYRELHDYMTDADYEKISKVARVQVSFMADEESKSVTLTCIEMENKWYLLRG